MRPPRPTDARRPFELNADVTRRVLRAEFARTVAPEDMRTEVEELQSVLAQLGPGFTLVSDLTDLEHMDIECVPFVTRMMDLCLAAGVEHVVRVIPHPDRDIGFGLLSLTHYRGKVPISTFSSRAEAEAVLPN